MDGWTKSKKSRTPTPEPVSSSDPKSAEDEAMDTSDDQNPNENSKNELVSKDGTETETSKDSLLLDEPKQSDIKIHYCFSFLNYATLMKAKHNGRWRKRIYEKYSRAET